MTTTTTTFDPCMIYPPHEARDMTLLANLTAAMRDNGWSGRPLLAWRASSDSEVRGLTGSHRTAAARDAGLDDVPVLLIECDDEDLAADLYDLRDFDGLVTILRRYDVDSDAIELAIAEDY